MSTHTPPGRGMGKMPAPGGRPRSPRSLRGVVREMLGRAHYERMRTGMAPTLLLPPWEELPAKSREAYRRRLDYLVPPLLAVIKTLRRDALDAAHADLLNEEIVG